jgi:hypothetical protein
MAAKWTIDNLNRLLILKAGVTDIDVEVDLYSDWKEEYKLAANAAFPPAMRSIGGDAVTATKDAGATFFMINGWRIRPDEANHTLNITGNLFTDPPGESVVVDTLGAFNVRVEMFVSNLVDAATARLDLIQLLQAVWIDVANGVAGTAEGVGTPTNPSNNITDARTIADRDGLQAYKFRGPLTINADHPNWTFEGVSSVANDELDLNGFDLGSTKIIGAKCTGSLTGQKQQFVGCDINSVTGLDGLVQGCWIRGSCSGRANGEIVFHSSVSATAGLVAPIYTLSANEQLNLRSYSGGFDLRGSTAGNNSTLELDPGNAILAASNTGGVIVLRGVGTYTDNSAGATVNTDGFVNSVGLADMIVNGVNLKSINGSVLAAVLLALAANTMARGTITVVNDATSVEVQFDDGFDPEAGDGIAGRAILYTTGSNVKGGARISSVDGQGVGDPLIGLTYAGTIQNAPQVGDTLLLV